MAEVELILERPIGMGHLDGIEVAAKQVLGEGELQGVLVRKLANDRRDGLEPGEPGGAPPSLAHNELEAAREGGVPAHKDGLDDAARPDGIGQLRKSVLREVPARLKRVGINEVEAHLLEAGRSSLNRLKEGVQSPAQHLSRHG
ncbi:hypothetical protein SBA2_20016 [Acidobacteriia bacterium SbA2]|nr:hypothetical protein SBA2_20016 [Acidobacteriia bacterium SbA2]